MSLDKIISESVSKAVKALYDVDTDPAAIVPQATRKEFEGNLTVVVFPWVKPPAKAPKPQVRKSADGWWKTKLPWNASMW